METFGTLNSACASLSVVVVVVSVERVGTASGFVSATSSFEGDTYATFFATPANVAPIVALTVIFAPSLPAPSASAATHVAVAVSHV